MAWFSLLQSRQEAKEQPQPQPLPAPPWAQALDRRHASSPTDWEVLSQGEDSDRAREVEVTTTEQEATSEETLTIIEGEDDTRNQIEALRKELEVTQREKEVLEEQLRQLEKDMGILKETSNKVVTRMRAELDEARLEVLRSKGEVERAGAQIMKLKDEMKVVAEESHQAQVRARLEVKGTRSLLDEKLQQMTKAERDKERLANELEKAKERINKLAPAAEGLTDELGQVLKSNEALKKESHGLKKEIQLLKDETRRITAQNAQVLAMLGVHSLERGDAHAFATKPDLVSDTQVAKMLKELNTEIFEASAYMADSFTFAVKPAKTDEMREACTRVTRMLGSTMVLGLTSVQHDEDPLIVQIACQACMIEWSRRTIDSWCFDGSKAEEVLPDLYSRIRKAGQSGPFPPLWCVAKV
jgi:hypothetical protein